ncbi:hypothetical protein [Lysinibacillus fusiformis]|uniref:hypothetical protein n=1 Tax=Lysinibacillus fusiformis TaxID=28031 RepID=UPI0035586094
MEKKIEFLRKLYGIESGDISYVKMETQMKQYNKFMKTFGLKERTLASTDIFKMIYIEKQMTLNSYMTSLKNNEEKFHNQLINLANRQSSFYKEQMYDKAWEEVQKSTFSMSDAQIMLDEYFHRHAVPIWQCNKCSQYTNNHCIHENMYFESCFKIEELDNFINNLLKEYQQFNNFIDKTLQLLVERNLPLQLQPFEEVITEAITKYHLFKENLRKIPKKTDNTYAHFYIYCRNCYIRKFYLDKFVYFISFDELDFSNIKFNHKSGYSLKEAAELFSTLNEKLNQKQCYENMKKQFQKSAVLQQYKKEDGEYFFPDIVMPLVHYHYYRKKNRSVEKDTKIIGNGLFIENAILQRRLVPIFHLYLYQQQGESNLKILKKYLQFIEEELTDIFSSLSWSYQSSLFNFLNETIVNIHARLIGIDQKLVYW